MKLKNAFLLLNIFVAVFLLQVAVFAAGAEVYLIGTPEEFLDFAKGVNTGELADKNARLTANIDFSDVDYTVIGTTAHPFTGKFDGDGYSVKNITITELEALDSGNVSSTVGVFGSILNAEITGLTVENITVNINDSSVYSQVCAGLLVGKAVSTDTESGVLINKCGVMGELTITCENAKIYAGGAAGYLYCDVALADTVLYDCMARVNLKATSPRFIFLGGFAGCIEIMAENAVFSMSKVFASGKIQSAGKSSFAALGGVSGYVTVETDWSRGASLMSDGITNAISDCFSKCSISTDAASGYTGSVFGYTMTSKPFNVYCPELYEYASSDRYSVGGKAVAQDSFSDWHFVSESLNFNVDSVWNVTTDLPTLKNKNNMSFEITSSEDTALITADGSALEEYILIVAVYSAEGRMIAVKELDNNKKAVFTLSEEPLYAKLFALDMDTGLKTNVPAVIKYFE